jgi:hypothetical protein
METADDPDPGGAVHPTVFYGLWPRFQAEEDAGEVHATEPAPRSDD